MPALPAAMGGKPMGAGAPAKAGRTLATKLTPPPGAGPVNTTSHLQNAALDVRGRDRLHLDEWWAWWWRWCLSRLRVLPCITHDARLYRRVLAGSQDRPPPPHHHA